MNKQIATMLVSVLLEGVIGLRSYALKRQLEDTEWVVLGSGNFSTVVMHTDFPEVVVKMGTSEMSSDGYWDYAEYAAKSRSRHAPRVYYLDRSRHVCVMERLHPWRTHDLPEATRKSMHIATRSKWKNPRGFHSGSLGVYMARLADRFEDEWGFDVHDANIMLRTSDMSFVVTDPLAYPRAA